MYVYDINYNNYCTSTHNSMFTILNNFVHIYVYGYNIYTYVYISTYVYIYIHTYIHMFIYLHMYMYKMFKFISSINEISKGPFLFKVNYFRKNFNLLIP